MNRPLTDEKSLGEIFKLFFKITWQSYILPKLHAVKLKTPQTNSFNQKLHLEAYRLQGELTLLETELNNLKYVKGHILDRTVTNKETGKIRNFKVLRWSDDGDKREKYLVKEKTAESQMTLEEAKLLLANREKAEGYEEQIKQKRKLLSRIEYKLSVLSGKRVEITDSIKEAINDILVGREEEISQIRSNLIHDIPTLLIGEPGVGKSFIAETLLKETGRPYITITNLKAARSVLVDQVILEQLHQKGLLKIDDDEKYSWSLTFEEVKSKCLKNKTIVQIAEIIRDSIYNSEHIVYIDSLAGLTQSNQEILDIFLEIGLPILACANRIKSSVELESIYRRFTKVEIKPLSKSAIREIFLPKVQTLNVGDYEQQLLLTKITNAACGNPGVAAKMFENAKALSVSRSLNASQIHNLQEPELQRRYFDLTPLVLACIAGFAVLRFVGIGTNDTLLYVMGGIAFVVFMTVGRLFMKR
ncbi:MAG: AAA family ATPase [Candidatus Caenarcaniphilales bacterium]|nr:AAA family ATPase [Candidatus Caenarcaniphilales bacterium]